MNRKGKKIMSLRELTNLKSRTPVCFGLEIKLDSDGYRRGYVVPVYPGDDLAEAIRRDVTCENFYIFDDKADAEREAEEMNAIAEQRKMLLSAALHSKFDIVTAEL